MNVISHWAIFWILVTYAVANSTKSGNENAVNVKVTRIVFPNLGGDEKRPRQRRDNLTEAGSRRSTSTDDASLVNVIEDGVRQSQHPVKKQIKFKRLRYLSGDQNSTKLSTDKLKNVDTKDLHRAKTTADGVTTVDIMAETKSNETRDAVIDGENTLSRSENTRTPSHRKKRRRIATSITALNTRLGLNASVNASSSRDNLSQYLDFGRKISATTTPRRNVLVVASVTDSADENVASIVDDQQNKTSTVKTPVGNGGGAATVGPILNNTSSICVTNYRAIRPSIKNLKREIIQNNTLLCRWNATDKPPEHINRQHVKSEPKNKVANETSSASAESKNQKFLVEGSEVSILGLPVTPSISLQQLTTKIFSTAMITSVSMKGPESRKTKMPSSTTDAAARLTRKPERDEFDVRRRPDLRYVYTGASNTSTLYSTMRPSLQPYSRFNAARNHSNRNLEISRLQYPPVGKIFYNVTLATTEAVKMSSANVSDADSTIEYLANTTTAGPTRQETDTLILDLTTWKSTTASIEVDHENNSSSTPPIFVTYDIMEKNTENWLYRVRNNTENGSSASAGVNPTKVTLFSRNNAQNYTNFGEQAFRPANSFHDAELFEDATTDRNNFHIVTYVLAGLGVIPLVIGIAIAIRLIVYPEKKKQIFEGSEYSSEYNRNPLEFSAGVTSSPIATKLPRVQQQAHWEIERKPAPSISAPINSQWEFPRNKLRLQTILGQGNFGQVWKAEADDISGHEGLTRLVAVKMVKEISSTREKEDLIKELMIMQHLGSHPNVVTLLGCCTEKEPYMLIMEYVMYGKLLSFLRDHRTRTHYFNFSDNGDTLTSRDLTVFAYYVARGMDYLQNKQVIHRDLAARNVLIDHNKLCKIADFGMSRYVDESGQVYEHRQSKGALPIRWMAPESLHYSCYTYKTDVWSFGILMWEIVTLGSMPYASMGARVVMRKVIEGYRLEKPKHCKSPLFNVISKCWHADPKKRPSFCELKQDLLSLLEDSESQGGYVDLDCLVEEMNQSVHGSHSEKTII